MPKVHTFPTLYNEVHQVKISRLKEWGYLDENRLMNGTITWSRNGEETGNIAIGSNTLNDYPFIELDYRFNGEHRRYKVNLVSIPSNLGKGFIWFFECPYTRRRCRILYQVDGYFYHRSAFSGCMYECQTYSHKNRSLIRVFLEATGNDQAYHELYSKYFKKHYRGYKTKRYKRILKKIETASRYTPEDVQLMYML